MRYSKLLINSILLVSFTATAFYIPAQASIAIIPDTQTFIEIREVQDWSLNDPFPTYDHVINFIDSLEKGELDGLYGAIELAKITDFLVLLARQGILPGENNEEDILENDIHELINGEDNPYEYSFSHSLDMDEYLIFPAVSTSSENIVLCKGWFAKKIKKIKDFIKDHKKEILIGAIVVVAVVVVVVTAGAAAPAVAPAATAATAAAASSPSSDNKEKNNSETTPEEGLSSNNIADVNDAPNLKATVEEHISIFKEVLVEDNFLHTSNDTDSTIGQNLRNFGSILAHQTLEGVSELAVCAPQLLEELKNIGHQIVPENFRISNDDLKITPKENYERLIIAGHEKIDEVFSTDLAERYSSETKETRNQFAIGILPPPGMFNETSINTNILAEAGKALDKAGFTKAGRALMKHGYREESVFPKPVGNPAQVNEHGQKVLESILNHPERQVIHKHTNNLGDVIDIQAPGLGGVRFNSSGEMVGFLEP